MGSRKYEISRGKMEKWREWRQRRVTCQQLIGYISTRERIRYFFTCVVTAFLRAGNPSITPQFMG